MRIDWCELPAADALPTDGRPVLVYVVDDTVERLFDKVASVILVDERIALTAQMFRCCRTTPEQAAAHAWFGGHGSRSQRVLVCPPDLGSVAVFEGRGLSVGTLHAGMLEVARAAYEEDPEARVKEGVRLVNTLDRIDQERTALGRKRAGAVGETAEALDLAVEALGAREAELRKAAEALWALTPQGARPADRDEPGDEAVEDDGSGPDTATTTPAKGG